MGNVTFYGAPEEYARCGYLLAAMDGPERVATLIETPRLIVRRLLPQDVSALVAIWTDADVTYYMGGPRDRSRVQDMLEAELRSNKGKDLGFWPVVEKASGELVGDCGLVRKDIDGVWEIELVYVFAKSAWKQGYATEVAAALRDHAFARLSLVRLVALIDPANAASERVAMKIGMRHQKDTLRPDGKTRKVYSISPLRLS
jgi:ribosomal-protein-alanine N-acetyltransferase